MHITYTKKKVSIFLGNFVLNFTLTTLLDVSVLHACFC